MPLLRLLPGLPRRIFSSSLAFLGGIFLDFAYVRTETKVMRKVGEKAEWCVEEKARAVLAAGLYKVGITEEKEKVRGLVGGVVVERGGEMTLQPPSSLVVQWVRWAARAENFREATPAVHVTWPKVWLVAVTLEAG